MSEDIENNFPKGSEWIKCDLHIHTPYSIANQHYGDCTKDNTWEKFIKDLENLPKDFKIIGINDYYFLDGYKKVLEFKNNGRLENIECILPVIELRVSEFGGTQSQFSKLNLHIIFSNQIKVDILEKQFIASLSAQFILNSEYESFVNWCGNLTKESLEDLGEEIKKAIPKEKNSEFNESNLILGFNNLVLNYGEVFKILEKNTYLKNLYITAIGKTEWANIKWTESNIASKKTFINMVDFVFTAINSVDDFNLSKKSLKDNIVNSRLIDCSDAHRFSDSDDKDRIGNCLTWIKTIPTFNGLKQILCEYEERVRISDEKPDLKNDSDIIESIHFNNKIGEVFSNSELLLNPNMNSIIGEKSSGKSLLLYLIAKIVLDNESLLECNNDLNSDLNNKNKNQSFLTKYDSIIRGLEISIIYRSKRKIDINNNEEEKNLLTYIPQGYLNNSVLSPSSINNIKQKIIDIIENREEDLKNEKLKYISFCQENEKKLMTNIEDYFLNKDEESRLKKELQKFASIEEVNIKLKEKNNALDQLMKQFANISDIELEKYNNTIISTNSKTTTIKELKQIQDGIKTIDFSEIEKSIKVFKDNILKKVGVSDSLFKSLDEILEYSSNKFNSDKEKELVNISQKIELLEKENFNLFESIKDINNKIKTKQELNQQKLKLDEEIKTTKEYLEHIKKLNEEIKESNLKKEKFRSEIVENFRKFETITISICDSYNNILKTTRIKEEVGEIKVEPVFDIELYKNKFENIYDLRSTEANKNLNYQYSSDTYFKHFYEKLFLNQDDMTFKQQKTMKGAFKEFCVNFFKIDFKIVYDGDEFNENMSAGKRAILLLKILIDYDKSKTPILIDQPEDDLDNKSITNHLVTYLKKVKKERQVILVSHNANIVVNGDSEEVILAKRNDKGVFSYKTGAIEEKYIKDQICEIMEGGVKAFKHREQKYNIDITKYKDNTINKEDLEKDIEKLKVNTDKLIKITKGLKYDPNHN